MTLNDSELLVVTGAEGDDAAAQVEVGQVESMVSVFDYSAHSLPPGSGMVIEARGQASGQPTILGELTLQESSSSAGGVLDVLPSFTGVGASLYELVVLNGGVEILQIPGLSGIAGQISLVANRDPRVEWAASGQISIRGFSAEYGFRIGGQSYSADQIVLRAENPTVQGEHVSTISWLGIDLNQIVVRDLLFNLGGWPHRLSGPFDVSPTASGIGAFFPELGADWALRVDVENAADWAIGLAAGALFPDASLSLGALASFDAGQPEEWKIDFSRRSAEPIAPSQWRVSFAFQAGMNSDISVFSGGGVVATLLDVSGEAVLFEPEDFEARMALADGLEPELSLSFADPVEITLVGQGAVMGDQIVAIPAMPLPSPAVELSAVEISGVGQSQVGLGLLEAKLVDQPAAILGCEGGVRLEVCKPPMSGDKRLEYRVIVDAPPKQGVCYDIHSPAAGSSAFLNLAPVGTALQGSAFRWQGCARSGTSCHVGFQADLPLQINNPVFSNVATVTDITGHTVTIFKKNLMPNLRTTHLPTCPMPNPIGIQICDPDDELIFEDGFECSDTRRWSLTEGGS